MLLKDKVVTIIKKKIHDTNSKIIINNKKKFGILFLIIEKFILE